MNLFNTLTHVTQRKAHYWVDAFEPRVVDEMIEIIKSSSEPYMDIGFSRDYDLSTNERLCWDAPLTDNFKPFAEEIARYINEANQRFYLFDLNEILSIMYFEYVPENEHSLDWHIDIGNHPPMNLRKISFSILANDPSEYEGGKLEIENFPGNLQVPKVKGGMVCFPSFLPHKVTPITKGIRKSIVGFIGGRPYR